MSILLRGAERRTSGGPFATVTSNVALADRFEPSVAVAVIVALPAAAGLTVSLLRHTLAAATEAFDEEAEYRSTSPSGSLKAFFRSTVSAPLSSSFSTSDMSGSAPAATTAGGRLSTVAANVCRADVAEPPASVAVTVIVALPPDTGVTVTVEPLADTVAIDDFDDEAA